MIPIGVKGRILNAGVLEPYILVEDDFDDTGGYLVLMSEDPEFKKGTGHDYWVLKEDLEAYFQETGWQVEWSESNSTIQESDASKKR